MRDFNAGQLSLNGMLWQTQEPSDRLVQTLVQKLGVSELIASLLVIRGVDSDNAFSYLKPTLKCDLPNPNTLIDMEKAASRVAEAIIKNEPIGVMGDYDVDGATSSAILKLFLESTGTKTYVFIPDREDGYGPNAKKMQEFKDLGCSVVLTADCGTTAYEPIEFGTNLGLDVIILDHHNAEAVLPKCYAVVNPKRLDEPVDHPCHYLAACGVCLKMFYDFNSLFDFCLFCWFTLNI